MAAKVTPNYARLTNAGNTQASPVFTIRGPVSDPALTLNGRVMRFGLDLTSDKAVVVDVATRTVELVDGPSRRHAVTGVWLTLPLGSSMLTFLAAS